MAWKQNPSTGESYQVPDEAPGAGTESGYQNPGPAKKPKVPPFSAPSGLASAAPVNHPGAPQLPPLPPGTPPPAAPPVQPIAYNGGYYNPTTAPHGWDQSAPGGREQFWENNQNLWFQDPQLDWVDSQQGKFEDPWAGEQKVAGIVDSIGTPGAGQQYWNGVQGEFNKMGNNAQTAFDMTKGMLPGSMQPQFDKYYDRMKEKSVSDVNSQSAARGSYGSSAGLNGSIGAALDVEAQRAKANTDFMLADSANQANWQGILGTQGRNADLSAFGKTSLGGQLAFESERMGFDKDKAQADLAFGMDDQALERMGAGVSTAFGSSDRHQNKLNDAFGAAGQADDERDERINTLYAQNSDFTSDVQNFIQQNLDGLLSGDSEAVMQQIDAMIAQTGDERGWDVAERERIRRDAKDFIDLAAKAKTAGVGGVK